MKKINKKAINVMATAALLSSVAAPVLAAPASNVSGGDIIVDKDAGVTNLGELTFKEDEDFTSDFKANRSFTITFPQNVKNVGTNVYWNGSSTPLETVNAVGDYTLNVTLPSTVNDNAQESLKIVPRVDVDGAEAGPIQLTIDGFNSGIPSGKYTVGTVAGSGDTTTTVIESKTIGESGKLGTIRITENSVKSMGNGSQKVKVKLPNDFTWDTSASGNDTVQTVVSFLGGFNGLPSITGANLNASDRTIEFTFNPGSVSAVANREQQGIIQIELAVNADSDADYGDVSVSVSGDKVDSADVVVGKYADFGFELKADGDLEELIAGRLLEDDDLELTELKIKETVENSLIAGRKTKVEFPSWIKIVGVEVSDTNNVDSNELRNNILADIDGTDNKVEFKVPYDGSGKAEFNLKFKVSIKANTPSGDITAKVTGRAGIEGEIVLGKVVAPVTITADAKDVKIGVKDQEVGDIIITENVKEAINKGELKVKLSDGAEWASNPKVEVIEGDLEIDEDSIDTDGEFLVFNVDSTSTKPSKIKISGVKLDLDRTIPEGAIEASVRGVAVVENDKSQEGYEGEQELSFDNTGSLTDDDNDGSSTTLDAGEFDQASVASAVAAKVVTPAPGERLATAVFTIDSTKYTVDGVEKTADVAPFIQDGRTFLPVRFVAEALGVSEDNIIWNANTKTATLIKGDRIAQIQIGSKNVVVNGVSVPMDVAAFVKDGRTVLPLRYVAQALGADVKWDEATRTVTIENN